MMVEGGHSSARTERLLIGTSMVFVVINYIALMLQRPESVQGAVVTCLVWISCTLTGHILLNRYTRMRDPFLYPIVMFLSGWGLVAIERLAPTFADRQTVWLVVSLIGLLITAVYAAPLQWLRNYRYLWLIFGLGLLLSTILLGRNPSGQIGAPPLWIGIGNVNFQPSEALKILLVAFLASYLAEQAPIMRAESLMSGSKYRLLSFSPRVLGPILLMWSLCIVVLIWQRDLGTAVLFFAIFLILLYVATGYLSVLLGGAVMILLAGLVAYSLFDVVRLRIDIWLNPWAEADGRAYQIVQSLQAFASGSVFGHGVGQGSPTYIPVVHSDFIFAAIGEEWGLLGVITIIFCIATLLLRGLMIALRCQRAPFQALVAVGLTASLGIQSIMIMGGVLRVLPLTGVTLPFLSYGGSSLMMSFIMIGLLIRLSSSDEKFYDSL